jgi:hypothetical protein
LPPAPARGPRPPGPPAIFSGTQRRARRAGPEAPAHLCQGAKADACAGLTERAPNAITTAVDSQSRSPFIYRKAGQSLFLRELLILFGPSGWVALFDTETASTVTILR